MAYLTANLVQKYLGGPNGRSEYHYTTTDAHTDVDAASYFSDGVSRHNMKVGDIVHVVVVNSVSAPTSVTTGTMHYVASVSGNAATIGAAAAGSTVTAVNNAATAAPAITDDTTPGGYTPGSIWVDVTNDNAWINVDATNGAARWLNIANDAVLGPFVTATLTSAGQNLARAVAPFSGKITTFQAVVLTACTGASAKLVRLVVSGNTIGSGTLTLTDGDAAGTTYSVTMTTDNTITAGNALLIQSGAQKCATGVFNFFIVCQKSVG